MDHQVLKIEPCATSKAIHYDFLYDFLYSSKVRPFRSVSVKSLGVSKMSDLSDSFVMTLSMTL